MSNVFWVVLTEMNIGFLLDDLNMKILVAEQEEYYWPEMLCGCESLVDTHVQ